MARWRRAETGHSVRSREAATLSNKTQEVTTMYESDYENEEQFTEETLQNALMELITEGYDSYEMCWENLRVQTYEQAGVMTYNKGLVITLPDGSEYQLTIVQSR
jgi:hypothetical protein